MEFTFLDRKVVDKHYCTTQYSLEEYIYPDMKTGFELYGMHLRSVKNTWEYPEHEHPKYEINMVLEGHQIFYVKGQPYEQRAGDIIITRPGDIHSSKCGGKDGFTYFCLHFDIDDKLFLPFLKNSQDVFFPSSSKLSVLITPYLNRLIQVCRAPQVNLSEKMKVHSLMFELLSALIEGLIQQDDYEPESEKVVKIAYRIAERIEQVVKRTEDSNSDNIDKVGIEEIANELNISSSYCHKIFKKVYNMSPRQYLSFKKLNEAKALLSEPDNTVEQIAYTMGYHDTAHFSRQFKRWSGLTPSQYRLVNVKRKKR
ncbi:AraC family transcriptional regulator [Alkalihalobacillus alcalophilus ATCC 27647 = CGMCC 1.3604]|uniref:AraC family transcriptional regulator n=1 Tax=Alkalihalobacillus alcalophilus ATCC 27647 = CGMCC 1.3604 TaxID=1218173 RepID=A0A094WS52_ALKAL|nr:AraC family transcriptional regulator [Alkalihalobacillus alcalophilus]KGA98878.1 AraC family transcriptional regulator [Alkalihalobacillus alcalophilus ATCC 27647 = CGMCC 1.3604]MED1560517.1 AraC family transcriptional regulator [Alkalihalobacillus alcalophilus]THG91787.1 AraC family transcriptional regulator [Alkalihalobacillus alcalophilus ATCC 27647 = CGMCC 1.3604]